MKLKNKAELLFLIKTLSMVSLLFCFSQTFADDYYNGFNTTYFKKWLIDIKQKIEEGRADSIISFDRNSVLTDNFLGDFPLSQIQKISAEDLISNFAVNTISVERDLYTVEPINGLISGSRVNQQMNVVFYKGHAFPTYYGFEHSIWEHSKDTAAEFKKLIETQPWYRWNAKGRGSYALQESSGSNDILNASAKLASLVKEDFKESITLWRGSFTSEVLLLKTISMLLKGLMPSDLLIQSVIDGIVTVDYFGEVNRANKSIVKLMENLRGGTKSPDLDLPKEGKKILKAFLRLHKSPLFFSDQKEPAEQTFGKGGLIGIEISIKTIERFVKRKDVYLGFEAVPALSEAYIEFASFSQAFFEDILANVETDKLFILGTAAFDSDIDIDYNPLESELWQVTEMPQDLISGLKKLSCISVLSPN